MISVDALLDLDEELEEGYAVMYILDETGDTRLMWNKNDPEEVAHARERYEELKAKGSMAYKVKRNGQAGEVLHAFDPSAERMIIRPPMKAG